MRGVNDGGNGNIAGAGSVAGGLGGAAGSRWASVPEEMKRLPRWVCWSRVERGGRATKMPVCAATGKMASSTDPGTWCSFAVAVASVGKWGTAGIGFVFGGDRTYTGLDLDHVLHDGVLEPEYQWVVDAADTYTEVSPSGDGLHLYFRGSKPEGATRCRKGPVEMYDHERFFTVTGKPFGAPRALAERPVVVEKAYRTWIEPEDVRQPTLNDVPRAPMPPGYGDGASGSGVVGSGGGGNGGVACGDGYGAPADLSDEELMDRMLRSANGAEIRALLGGDTSAQGGDHSAADMALCNHLAFWCAGDEARMDRFFRGSGLMRDKWDTRRGGTTYGAQTLANAVRNARDFYKPRRPRRPDGWRTSRQRNVRQGTRPQAQAPANEAQVNGGSSVAATDTYRCSTAGQEGVTGGIEGAPERTLDPERAPSVEKWVVEPDGSLWVADADGRPRYSVTSTAPWVACDLLDVDSGDMRALVRCRVRGKVRERAFERGDLMSQNRVVTALAPLGVNVSSSNAKDIVTYLTTCESRLGEARPLRKSVTHMGWDGTFLGSFMPYDAADPADGEADEGRVRFDPAPDAVPKIRPFLDPAGTLEGWVAGVAPARAASMAFRCVMAASFASPLVSILGVQTFIVYLWGRSRSGKTPTLKAAGSVWGDPTEGPDSYFRTFGDTPKSIIRAAALLHDIPVIIDELQTKGAPGGQAGKRMTVEDLLYMLSIGRERDALSNDRRMMRAGSWKSLTICTGEIPIVGDSTMQGAANRTLELNAQPFKSTADAREMHRLVAREHGTAGRAFIAALRGNDEVFFSKWYADISRRVDAVAAGHPQAVNVALLAFADALAEFYVFSPGTEWAACVEGAVPMAAWALEHATDAAGGDTDLKAIQRVAEIFAESSIHFDDYCENDRLERWGLRETRPEGFGTYWYVFPGVLERDLTAHGFDKQKTLRRMDEEGLLVRGRGRGFGKQKRLRGTDQRLYCICVDGWELERFLGRAHGEEDGAAAGPGPVAAGAGVGGAVAGAAGGGAAGGGAGGGAVSGTTVTTGGGDV